MNQLHRLIVKQHHLPPDPMHNSHTKENVPNVNMQQMPHQPRHAQSQSTNHQPHHASQSLQQESKGPLSAKERTKLLLENQRKYFGDNLANVDLKALQPMH
jgi:hypothetical protein